MNRIVCLVSTLVVAMNLYAEETPTSGNPTAVLQTSKGEIRIELFAEKSPVSVANFIQYAKDGFYDGTIFHRVISNFMIQGGGFMPDMKQKTAGNGIVNESHNGLSNLRGTIAMARTPHPDSATAQFFINVQDNPNLDYALRGNSPQWGYAVFGKVTSGMEVVDEIRSVETTQLPPYSDVPKVPVLIESVQIIEAANP